MSENASEIPATPPNPSDGLLNKKELAKRLKITVRTVENWQQRRIVPFVKVGKVVLFYWPDVLEYLRENFRVLPAKCLRTVTISPGERKPR